jgi:peptidoglycan LD-endopeptidase CwlK
MGLNRNLSDLEPKTKKAAEQGVAILKAQDIRFYVSETRRTREVQAAYFAQGRQPLAQVNALRSIAGLWPITEKENAKQITQTLKSKHIDGKAIDICPADKAGGPLWNAPKTEYQKIAVVMKSVGFEWGGDWKGFEDCPHYQIKEV